MKVVNVYEKNFAPDPRGPLYPEGYPEGDAKHRSLFHLLEEHTLTWLIRAEELYGQSVHLERLDLDICSFRTAGQAVGGRRIRYNPSFAEQNLEDFLNRTVPHEVAHIVNHQIFKGRSHDAQWKQVMRDFGLEPIRCHSYPMPERVGNRRSYEYRCACRTVRFTDRKHRQSERHAGAYYRCNQCHNFFLLRNPADRLIACS